MSYRTPSSSFGSSSTTTNNAPSLMIPLPFGSPSSSYIQPPPLSPMHPSSQRRTSSRTRFFNELTQCIYDFILQLLPTPEELAVKEDVRKLLEKLVRELNPNSRLLSFGSTANGFSLAHSDMDLCCLLDGDKPLTEKSSKDKPPSLSPGDLVTQLGKLLEEETKFHVKPLPFARIPIVKLSLDPSPGLPFGITCDIGFDNKLALENTRLLQAYANVDPGRVRVLILFLKVWTKRRKINSPYGGTLSSYGYVLLVIYFLVHVKNPPVLPNLQQMPPLRPISHEDMHIGERNVWFFDDIELLRRKWQSSNFETAAELLVDFFKYYSRDFSYNTGVASIRAGLLTKESKGWQSDPSSQDSARDRNRLCVEDPFELDYNVSRTVTKDGLYTIRGEFMRACRILQSRPENAMIALAQLCEERDDALVPASNAPYPYQYSHPYVPRLASFPSQLPYPVGSSPRPIPYSSYDPLSPPRKLFDPLIPPTGHVRNTSEELVENPPQLPHMAPRRGPWTSPPPPDASPAVHESYSQSLGTGLSLATSSSAAREAQAKSTSSSSTNGDAFTDEELQSNATDSQPPSPPASGYVNSLSGKPPSPDVSRLEALKLSTPRATQHPRDRGRSERIDDEPDTPRKADDLWPALGSSLRRASSGPPTLRTNSAPSLNGTAAGGSSPRARHMLSVKTNSPSQSSRSSPHEGPNVPQHVPSPLGPPPMSHLQYSWHYAPHMASAAGYAYAYAHVRPPPPPQRHQHSASTSSNASPSSHYPSPSVTIYRSQPQATAFPLYQQTTPSSHAGASASTMSSTNSTTSSRRSSTSMTGYGEVHTLPSPRLAGGQNIYLYEDPIDPQFGGGSPSALSPALPIYSPMAGYPYSGAASPSIPSPVGVSPAAEDPGQIAKTSSPSISSSISVSSISSSPAASSFAAAPSSSSTTTSTPPMPIRKSSAARPKGKYDPSAAFRIPTTFVNVPSPSTPQSAVSLPPSPPESQKSFGSNMASSKALRSGGGGGTGGEESGSPRINGAGGPGTPKSITGKVSRA